LNAGNIVRGERGLSTKPALRVREGTVTEPEEPESAANSSRGRIVVVDENDATRTFVTAALISAGYEVIPVATTLGLRKALRPNRPTIVVCDVSPPLTFHQVVASAHAIRAVTEGRARLVLCGSQSCEQLAILVRACGAAGYIERREDPMFLLRGIRGLLTAPRDSMPPERLDELRRTQSRPQWAIIKLLLVDDSEVTLELMQERLRTSGFDVRIAVSLGEVRSIIEGWSPNVIVADVNMPDMRGDDLCTRLKAAAATRDAIVMLCSSMPEEQLGAVADAAGADGFVSKNNGLDHFVECIEAMCRRISNPVVSFD
jgi:DNA-binding response OmpR family regulator